MFHFDLHDSTVALTECALDSSRCQEGTCDHGMLEVATHPKGDLIDLVDAMARRSEQGLEPPRPMPTPIRRLLRLKEKAGWEDRDRGLPLRKGLSVEECARRLDLRLLSTDGGPAFLHRYELTYARMVLSQRDEFSAEEVAEARFRGLRLLSREIEPGDDASQDSWLEEVRSRYEAILAEVLSEGVFLPREKIAENRKAQRVLDTEARDAAHVRMMHERDGCPARLRVELAQSHWDSMSDSQKEAFGGDPANYLPEPLPCPYCDG